MSYLITPDGLPKLRAVAARLYSERRMTGDDVRDAAVADTCEQPLREKRGA